MEGQTAPPPTVGRVRTNTAAGRAVAGAGVIPGDTIRISDRIRLVPLSEHVYVHVTAAQIPPYGTVWSNGMLLADGGEALLFDTPMDDAQTDTLVRWIADSLHLRLVGFVPNHWHGDCMGGLGRLQRDGVPSYAHRLTIEAARREGKPVPERAFGDSLELGVGAMRAVCYYLGGGHTLDNIVVWVPAEKTLFAGCMVKEMAAREPGNLSDAVVEAWPGTLGRVLERFDDARTVIPGHGAVGGLELVEHTRDLVRQVK